MPRVKGAANQLPARRFSPRQADHRTSLVGVFKQNFGHHASTKSQIRSGNFLDVREYSLQFRFTAPKRIA